MAKNDVRVLKIDTDAAQTSVKELRQQLKELKDTLLSTEKGTEEYNKTLQQAADIQHTLKEQMEEVNASAMDFGQITGNIVKATGGMVAGFQAAKATMNLFGIENENVIKSLEKMQSLMAITQAIPSIDNGMKAFKRLGLVIKGATAGLSSFKAALAATGIGLAVLAVAALAANWDKVTAAMEKWGIINENTKAKLEEQKKKVEELKAELSKLEGDYADWEKANKVSKLNSDAKKSYDDLTESITRYKKQLDIIVSQQKLPENQSRERWEALNKEGLALLDNISALEKQQRAILDNAESYKVLTDAEKEYIKTQKELAILLASSLQYIQPKSLQEELDKKFEGKPLKIPVTIGEAEDEADVSKADELKEKITNTIVSLRNAFMTPEEQYQQEINALDLALQTKLIKEEEYLKLRDALNAEQTQKEVLRYTTAANSIADIFNNLGGLMEEGSEEQKAIQIMGATINMLSGIVAAIAGTFTTHTGVWDIALAALQATAIATAGAVNIKKIAQTNKNNAKSMATGAKSSTSALSSVIAPVQYTQDVQGASIEGAIKDSRVYVVESDITGTQNKVSVTEDEARF